MEVGDCRVTVRLDEVVRETCKIPSGWIRIAGLQKKVTDPAEVRRVRNPCQRNQRLLSIRSAARDLLPEQLTACRAPDGAEVLRQSVGNRNAPREGRGRSFNGVVGILMPANGDPGPLLSR